MNNKVNSKLTVTFISNYLNHHQLPFCKAMCNNEDIEFTFIATEQISKERRELGYEDMNSKYDFVIEAYKDNEKIKSYEVAEKSDVVIIGSAPTNYISKRLKENKLTFKYSERVLKGGTWTILNPRIFIPLMMKNTFKRKKRLYMLCNSAYTAFDYSLVGAYIDKCYKWGYFPETKKYDIEELIKRKMENKPIKILWVARFLKLKHPEIVVELAKRLRKRGQKFEIQMIGNGELFDKIKSQIDEAYLTDYIKLLGPVKSSDVRRYMENANIFLATSDQHEGWGAVVNEAMNSACVVVGSKEIGSVPYLIEHKKNGLVYSKREEFFECIEEIINDSEKQKQLAINAYETIVKTWNAENAANNLIILCKQLLDNKEPDIKYGPCSKDLGTNRY